jgi:hypothetical protein|uniref:Uncharacterized protein n=1 Tax=viral metagenome TaxID=1070528 RepID=A0A6C0J9K3_9ZZZZ
MSETTFNLEYFLSIFLALAAGYSVHRMAPSANSIVKFFVIPLIVAYASLTLFNMVLPKLNKYGDLVGNYVEINALSSINSMNYLQVFPPILAVFLIFMVLIYNKNI